MEKSKEVNNCSQDLSFNRKHTKNTIRLGYPPDVSDYEYIAPIGDPLPTGVSARHGRPLPPPKNVISLGSAPPCPPKRLHSRQSHTSGGSPPPIPPRVPLRHNISAHHHKHVCHFHKSFEEEQTHFHIFPSVLSFRNPHGPLFNLCRTDLVNTSRRPTDSANRESSLEVGRRARPRQIIDNAQSRILEGTDAARTFHEDEHSLSVVSLDALSQARARGVIGCKSNNYVHIHAVNSNSTTHNPCLFSDDKFLVDIPVSGSSLKGNVSKIGPLTPPTSNQPERLDDASSTLKSQISRTGASGEQNYIQCAACMRRYNSMVTHQTDCVCNPQSCIEACTCVSCFRFFLNSYSRSDSKLERNQKSKSRLSCLRMFLVSLLSIPCLPCLACYWPLSGIASGINSCYKSGSSTDSFESQQPQCLCKDFYTQNTLTSEPLAASSKCFI